MRKRFISCLPWDSRVRYTTWGTLSPLHKTQRSDWKDRAQWRWLPAQHSRHVLSVAPTPSQVSLCSKCEALQVELTHNEDDNLSNLEELPRLSWPKPRHQNHFHRVIVVGDSFWREQKTWYTALTHFSGKPVGCLGPRLRTWWQSFLLWYGSQTYLLLTSRVGSDELAARSRETSGPWDNRLRDQEHK